MVICETCLHRVVCGKYTATGGVNKCDNHKEERRGRWMFRKNWDFFVCSECSHESSNYSNYCPNCGAKMDGGNTDG